MAGKANNSLCQGKDIFERMNFLYQAGTLMSSTNPVLSCYYGQLCRAVAKKAVLRMEPSIKRSICKACGNILVAGTSAHIRMHERNPKLCEIECTKCGNQRRFTINSKYNAWLDDARSVKERLHIDSVRTKLVNQQTPKCNKKTKTQIKEDVKSVDKPDSTSLADNVKESPSS